ncbi:hypothetical protein GF359_06910 [candidate division WOR-3 bacterium]|uniref:Metallophosphoesterase TT1561-like domain-containing protein n=1 Tax=candidate division WOR-3 bacterium TaxID=2052148 RepID=A0A9D5K9Q0_UNCW3|nr:hypothetical protein [candidate division WOR-3 bacterium]MBD3364928.1 hypothetical protein [candidate division WOR-3 bacterium]
MLPHPGREKGSLGPWVIIRLHTPQSSRYLLDIWPKTGILRNMRIALFADYHGGDRVWPLLEEALEDQGIDLIAFAGDILESEEREALWRKVYSTGKSLSKSEQTEDENVVDELRYREFFVNLTGFGVPVVFVPGHIDSPTSRLDEAVSGFPDVHNVQKGPFEFSDYTIVGRGGAVGPVDADSTFYSSKTTTFKKHFSKAFDFPPEKTILLVHNPPVSRVAVGQNSNEELGAEILNRIIEKNKPAYCFCGHAHASPGQDSIASTIVVNPGPMFRGRYAIIDAENHRVLFPTPLKV